MDIHTPITARATFPATLYLGVDDMVRLVQRVGLPACIAGVAERIEADFRRWPEFDKSARLACHSADGVIELMPIADAERFTFKYVNGHPKNTRAGLPTVMAFGVLADVGTGAPRLLSDHPDAGPDHAGHAPERGRRRLPRPGKTELHADVLRCGPVFVEYAPQSRIEGEVQQMPAEFPVTEFWQVLTGQALRIAA